MVTLQDENRKDLNYDQSKKITIATTDAMLSVEDRVNLLATEEVIISIDAAIAEMKKEYADYTPELKGE